MRDGCKTAIETIYLFIYPPLRQKRKNKYIIKMHTTGPTAKEIL